MYTMKDLLKAREDKVEFIKELYKRYGETVLTIRANYPGLEKQNSITTEIVNIVDVVVERFFLEAIDYKLKTVTAEGPICIYVIEQEAMTVKDIAMDIEDKHTLGRCVDIDVYDRGEMQLSRINFGKEGRRCFICDKPAHECVRSRAHSPEEIIKFIADRYNDYFNNMYGSE